MSGIRNLGGRGCLRWLLATTTALASLGLIPQGAFAGPVGGSVVSGAATIAQSGGATTISQSSEKAIINWQGFSIGSSESVAFKQPDVSSVALNRVTGPEASTILGSLTANGQVWLVNPNGVLFGKTASVNVGGLVATTLDISNADFLAGRSIFSGTSTASVVNRGVINSPGGYVSLMGKTVENDGTITADLGTVAMTGGSKITLDFAGNSLFDVTIDQGVMDALVANKQLVRADGGKVILTAKAADAILSAQVNNSGIVEARTISALTGGEKTGSIKLYAYGGKTNVSGKLDASAPKGGNGGAIETSGDKVTIADDARITTAAAFGKTGTWTLDPTDFTIAASGGDITGRLLSGLLALNNVAFSTSNGTSGTSGNLYVNDAVSWSAGTSLRLTAANNLTVNSAITASGTGAGLNLTATGGNLTINAPITMSGSNATMALNANTSSGYVYVNNAITLSGASNDALTINALDYVIRTPASYAGTTTDANGKVVAVTDTSGGTYGSINFTSSLGSASGDSLTINGNPYTLVFNYDQLASIDGLVNGAYYDPATGKYDITVGSIPNNVTITTGYAQLNSSYTAIINYYDVATQAYDIPATKVVNGATKWYNPASGLYELNSQAPTPNNNAYYYDPATGKYDISKYNSASNAYWDPVTKQYDILSKGWAYSGEFFYDTTTGVYDIPSKMTVSGTSTYNPNATTFVYYNPATKSYILPSDAGRSTIYYDPKTGIYDLSSAWTPPGYQYYAIAQNLTASGISQGSPVITYDGVFAGLGHTIDKMTLSGTSDVGLIGALQGTSNSYSVVRDLGLTNASIAGTSYVGGIAGAAQYANFTDVYVTGAISMPTGNDASDVGGLVGSLTSGTITNAYTNVSITGPNDGKTPPTYTGSSSNIGGIVGYAALNTISKSDALGNILCSNYCGGLVGNASGLNISNSYASGNVTAYNDGYALDSDGLPTGHVSDNLGGLVGSITRGTVTASFATGAVSNLGAAGGGNSNAGGLIGLAINAMISGSWASGNVSSQYGGAGGLVGELETVGSNPSSTGIVNSYASGAVTSGTSGITTSDTGGLVGMTYDLGSNGAPIIISGSYASGDVTVDPTTHHTAVAGGLIGTASANTTISDSSSSGNVTDSGGNAGGLAGNNYGTISNSHSTGTVKGFANSGGLVGVNSGSITGSWASGNVTSSASAGGLVGYNSGSIGNSSASGNVTIDDYYKNSPDGESAGGLVGANRGKITNSTASGDVTTSYAGTIAGAIVGMNGNGGSVTGSRGTGSVSQNGVSTGAIGTDVDALGGFGTESGNSYTDVKAVAAAEAAAEAAAQAAAQQAAQAAAAEAAAQHAAVVKAAARQAAETTRVAGGAVSHIVASNTGPIGAPAPTLAATPPPPAPSARITLDASEAAPAAPPPLASSDEKQKKVAARASSRKGSGSGSGAGYGASVRSLEIGGHTFDLDQTGAPAPAPAPAGGQ